MIAVNSESKTTTKKSRVVFGISKKEDGQMIIGGGKNDDGEENREKYFSKINIDYKRVVSTDIIHQNNIEAVTEKDKRKVIKKTDGIVTDNNNLILTTTVSDCLPIYFYDKEHCFVGIMHAGWRNIIENVGQSIIKKTDECFIFNPQNFTVFIGPHIKQCHFEVKEDVKDIFSQYSKFIKNKNGSFFISLAEIAKEQFLKSGVRESNINISKDCTFCSKNYFSFRRDKPKKVASQIAYIYLKK